ncbi:hypothetical protein FIBSPDRAFT_857925 [Athelia psychrophila]|uniref:Nitroreductase domain-containing protein n=1 Tax=Athelia psychrophila TaxID=1759441 RepID=A0A166MA72_9AGAM|nr:hypothetical protein FIBSPDRAFT_857925 [Fibularhizoctonia sp. CBS 109695]
MQSARVVLLTGAASQNLWAAVRTEFLATLGDNASAVEMHSAKFDGYAAGFGTVLFFEDQATLDKMAAAFPGVPDGFAAFSQNSTGMLQFAVWTALKAEGLGASLQHHGMAPSVAAAITQQLGISADWKNTAIMPFGVPTAEPGEKTFLPIEERVLDFE